jgi:hypothetical protein
VVCFFMLLNSVAVVRAVGLAISAKRRARSDAPYLEIQRQGHSSHFL